MWANNLRVISVFAVIILHVASGFVGGVELTALNYGDYIWWAGNIYDSLTRWSVPLFVMISGYFLINKEETTSIFFKKRLNKIFLPMIFWSLFFTLWMIIKYFIKGELSAVPITIAKGWVQGKPYFHLWYLFMIPFLYLITPALRAIFKSFSKSETLIFVVFCFLLSVINTLSVNVLSYFGLNAKVSIFTNGFLSYIGYFCLGGYIAKYNIIIKTNLGLLLLILSWFITIFGSYLFSYEYFYSYLSLNTVVASISMFFLIRKLLNKNIKIDFLSKFTFGIYLIHPLFLDVFSYMGRHWLLDRINIYIYIPLTSLTVFILSYGAVLVMSKIRFFNKCV